MVTIDLEKAREELKAVVDAAGRDHVYKLGLDGFYSYTKCIVGCVLNRLGLTKEELAMLDHNGGYDSLFSSERVQGLLSDFNLDFTPEAEHYLTEAQARQDSGKTWGAALYEVEDQLLLGD